MSRPVSQRTTFSRWWIGLSTRRGISIPILLALFAVEAACDNGEAVSLVRELESDLRTVELDGDSRRAVAPSFPATLTFDVEVPARRPLLSFALATATETTKPAKRARVEFLVSVESEGSTVRVFRRSLRSQEHNTWHDVTLRLDAWAGRSVKIRMATQPTRAALPVPWAKRIQTLWGEPRIVEDAPVEKPKRASTILIVVDTLRYDYLGVNGFAGDVSSNLDWLALESTRFDNAFSTAPWTKPSVASLLTGLHPQTHGVRDHAGKVLPSATEALGDGAITLAEIFEEEGYDTAAFVGNAWLAPAYGFGQGFDTYVVDARDERLLELATEWLASRTSRRPYFLYLHLIGVHGPYRAPETDYLALRNSPSLLPDRAITASDPRRPAHLDATPWARAGENERLLAWKAKYAATVRKVDRQLGRFVGQLRDSGELDRARLVFTSDHGEEFLEHGSWEHGYSLCDHQIRVPLWFREPGASTAGRRIREVVSLVDVMPTLLRLSSLDEPAMLEGRDRSEWFLDPGKAFEATTALSTGILNRPDVYSLRTHGYQLLLDQSSKSVALFDVDGSGGPGEAKAVAPNIASIEPEVVERLRRILEFRLDRIASKQELDIRLVPLSKEIRRQLLALGYLE